MPRLAYGCFLGDAALWEPLVASELCSNAEAAAPAPKLSRCSLHTAPCQGLRLAPARQSPAVVGERGVGVPVPLPAEMVWGKVQNRGGRALLLQTRGCCYPAANSVPSARGAALHCRLSAARAERRAESQRQAGPWKRNGNGVNYNGRVVQSVRLPAALH